MAQYCTRRFLNHSTRCAWICEWCESKASITTECCSALEGVVLCVGRGKWMGEWPMTNVPNSRGSESQRLLFTPLGFRNFSLFWVKLDQMCFFFQKRFQPRLKRVYDRSGAIQYNTTQYNIIQYNTVKYNAIQHNTVQCHQLRFNRSTRAKVASRSAVVFPHCHDLRFHCFQARCNLASKQLLYFKAGVSVATLPL